MRGSFMTPSLATQVPDIHGGETASRLDQDTLAARRGRGKLRLCVRG
jgi:hypothetical protein